MNDLIHQHKTALAGLVCAVMVLAAAAGAYSVGMQAGIQSVQSVAEKPRIVGYVIIEVYRPGIGVIYHHEGYNLLTNTGKDWIEQQLSGSVNASQCAKYIALSSDTGTPQATDTVLTGEITSGGLARAAGTYTSTGVGQWKVEKQFTATATHTAVQKSGLFNIGTKGDPNDVMVFENTFNVAQQIRLASEELQSTLTATTRSLCNLLVG